MAGRGADRHWRVRLLHWCGAFVAAAVVALTIPVGSAAADASSDIPGIPLPGSVATGQLGGPIYDVVYQFVVSPGSLIVASLTGSAGTDFDMYLFDSTATTVLQKTGLVAESTGPTSTESISYGAPAGGTYYIDLNGATDVAGTFRLVVQAVADRTPPSVTSLTLGNGSGVVNSLTVNVTVAAVDDLSGVTDMAFSLDGTSWAAWVPYAKDSSWTFEGVDGTYTLWAKVRNGVGLESTLLAASVRVDTVPPHAIRVDPPPGAQIEGLRPRLSVQFDEPISVASWQNLGLVVQSAGGAIVAGAYTYDPATFTGSYVPSAPLDAGRAYAVTLGDVTDLAGNHVLSIGSWVITPLVQPTLDIVAAPKVLLPGGSTRLTVTLLEAPAPSTVTIQARPAGTATFVPIDNLVVSTGTATLEVDPARNTEYRCVYLGIPPAGSATADVNVLVRRKVELVGAGPVTHAATSGRRVTLAARVTPAAGARVSFQLYRLDTRTRSYRYAGSFGRAVSGSGGATVAWTPSASGRYYWRVSVLSSSEFANNVSALSRWTVAP